ncbi:ribosome maturation factor RimP [Mucilaginibacter gracilis]|uniref:Ribosome maturation factor RimP n=1 Tax=Mucilaginibacter gracilis TaxID=423350 RepID=A0A495J9I7_9SPHI|nr:ribosome assembly cofactor RimP [Mucilaginibacter gracilis]RKR85680.1 ribosome maturation factor RimP [Mucilaginibacter gracilis]
MNIEKRVAQLVEEKLTELPGVFVVDIKMLPNHKLIILIDGDEGLGVGDCAKVSRYVGFKLEEENVIEEAYNLEVSSPGIDTPLTLVRQYAKNIGRDLSVKTTEGAQKEGKLLSVTEDSIVIDEIIKAGVKGRKAEVAEATIPLSQIAEAKVLISFK